LKRVFGKIVLERPLVFKMSFRRIQLKESQIIFCLSLGMTPGMVRFINGVLKWSLKQRGLGHYQKSF